MTLDVHTGLAAGLTTSVLWTFTALFFTAAGRRIGATVVNGTRILMAIVLLGVTHRLLVGSWIPPADPRQMLLLGLSGLVGLTLGDWALFSSFVQIGPRVAMLVMTTAPIFAALLGWLLLHETPQVVSLLGIVMTVAGVAWVVLERPSGPATIVGAERARGITLAVIAAVCQAAGLLLSKQGIGHGWLPAEAHLAPQAATLVRMFFAGVTVVPVLVWHAVRTRARRVPPALAENPADAARRPSTRLAGYAFTLCGAIVGPYLGVWLSLVAVDRTHVGVAQTTCSLSPVFILPFVVWLHGERVSARAVLGAALAVAGIGVLFLAGGC